MGFLRNSIPTSTRLGPATGPTGPDRAHSPGNQAALANLPPRVDRSGSTPTLDAMGTSSARTGSGIQLSESCGIPQPTAQALFEADRDRQAHKDSSVGLWPGGHVETKSDNLHRQRVDRAKAGPRLSSGPGILTKAVCYGLMRAGQYEHDTAVGLCNVVGAGTNLVGGFATPGPQPTSGPPAAVGHAEVRQGR